MKKGVSLLMALTLSLGLLLSVGSAMADGVYTCDCNGNARACLCEAGMCECAECSMDITRPPKWVKKDRSKEGRKEARAEARANVTLTKKATLYASLGNAKSVIGTLAKGTGIHVDGVYGDWVRIRYGSDLGKAGYIRLSETAYK